MQAVVLAVERFLGMYDPPSLECFGYCLVHRNYRFIFRVTPLQTVRQRSLFNFSVLLL